SRDWSSDVSLPISLESSTLTPLLKRLEAAGLVRRTRNPANERQVLVSLTDKGHALRSGAGCLGEKLLETSGQSVAELARLNRHVARLRDSIYERIGGGWGLPAAPHRVGRAEAATNRSVR